MNTNPIISVIVPVYKVEQYLSQCVDSILNQSYDNLEIILVDDGSPDRCPEMCDGYAQKDSRIRVIHKKNGGLSDARNKGIDVAKGDYLYFVDSDDCISEGSVEYLYHLIKKYDAEVAIGGMAITTSLEKPFQQVSSYDHVYDNVSALSEMMYNKRFNHSASAKLYKASLFEGVRYPVGKLYEDLFTTYRVVNQACRIAFGSQVCYYYYIRQGSIMQSTFTPKNNDVVDGLFKLKCEIPLESYDLKKPYASLVVDCITTLLEKNPRKNDINEGWNLLKKNRMAVVLDKNASYRVRTKALLSYGGVGFLKTCIKLYTKCK